MKPAAPPKQELSGDDSTIDKSITEIRANDVLLGRGAGPNEHTGNIAFRVIVAKQKAFYMATTNRQEKNKIAIKTMKIAQAQKGRFLQKVKDKDDKGNDDVYVIAADKVVLEKVKQALRHQDRARGSKSDTWKDQETIKLSRPLHHQGMGPAQVGPLLNAFFLRQEQQDASIAQRRSAAFSILREQEYSDLPIVSPQSSYSQLSACDINAAALSLGIQAEIPNRSGVPPSTSCTTSIDNLRQHREFQEQLNTVLATCSYQDREREKQAVANSVAALMDARNNSADNTLLRYLLKEYAPAGRGLSTASGTSGSGINQLLLSSVSSPFLPVQRGGPSSSSARGSTADLMPSPLLLDQLPRLLEANHGNPAGSSPVKSLENKMFNLSGGNGLQSSSLQPTASSYLLGNHNRGLQQGNQDQAAVAALRDNSARVLEVLALLGKKPSTC